MKVQSSALPRKKFYQMERKKRQISDGEQTKTRVGSCCSEMKFKI